MPRAAVLLLALPLLFCGKAQRRAGSVPVEADIAAGATHDLLVVACKDEIVLTNLIFGVGATVFFVGMGRLDAALYLPDAVVGGLAPQCVPVPFSLSGTQLAGDGFTLEPTPNPAAFHVHSSVQATGTFTTKVHVDPDDLDVSSTFRAWKPNHVNFGVNCQRAANGLEVLDGWLPVGTSQPFQQSLFHDKTQLSGYGYYGVVSPGLQLGDSGGQVFGTVTTQPGPFNVSSPDDPSFSLTLTAYDATAYDSVRLTRETNELVLAGATTQVRATALIGGKTPCVDGFVRTLETATPSVCRFNRTFWGGNKYEDESNSAVEVEALAAGTCTLTVGLVGSSLVDTLSFRVYRGFDTIALPGSAIPAGGGITDFWGQSPDEMVLVGFTSDVSGFLQSLTTRRTGGVWKPTQQSLRPAQLQAVHGADPSTVFAVGHKGGSTHWNGASWQPIDAGTTSDLNDVFTRSASEAYAAGMNGAFLRFDGAQWNVLDAGTTANLHGVWGDELGQIYAVGEGDTAKRWDGGEATDLLPAGLTDGGLFFSEIDGTGSNDVWIVARRDALHFDGAGWQRPLAPILDERSSDGGFVVTSVPRVAALPGGYAYFLLNRDDGQFLARWDGSKLVLLPVPVASSHLKSDGRNLFLTGKGEILVYRHDPADVFP